VTPIHVDWFKIKTTTPMKKPTVGIYTGDEYCTGFFTCHHPSGIEHLHMSIYQWFLEELIYSRIVSHKRYCEASSIVHCSILCVVCNEFTHKGSHHCQHKLFKPRVCCSLRILLSLDCGMASACETFCYYDENSCRKH
jgi:hypothetical protein